MYAETIHNEIVILTGGRMIRFLPGACRVTGQNAPCRKENLTVRGYNANWSGNIARGRISGYLHGENSIENIYIAYVHKAQKICAGIGWVAEKMSRKIVRQECGEFKI